MQLASDTAIAAMESGAPGTCPNPVEAGAHAAAYTNPVDEERGRPP